MLLVLFLPLTQKLQKKKYKKNKNKHKKKKNKKKKYIKKNNKKIACAMQTGSRMKNHIPQALEWKGKQT